MHADSQRKTAQRSKFPLLKVTPVPTLETKVLWVEIMQDSTIFQTHFPSSHFEVMNQMDKEKEFDSIFFVRHEQNSWGKLSHGKCVCGNLFALYYIVECTVMLHSISFIVCFSCFFLTHSKYLEVDLGVYCKIWKCSILLLMTLFNWLIIVLINCLSNTMLNKNNQNTQTLNI